MPVHIGELTSEISVVGGDLPLGRDQFDRLVAAVIKRLEQLQRDAKRSGDATRLRNGVSRTGPIGS